MIKLKKLILFFISILPPFTVSRNPIYCDRSCPGAGVLLDHVPYPFGFSAGCEIELNCTSNGTVLIGEFSVQQLNADGLLLSLPAACGRAVETLHHLYGDHYAPTSNNAILMKNCTDKVRKCMIPATMLQTNLEVIDCGGGDDIDGNVSCYSGDQGRMFLDYEDVTRIGCRFLFSGVVSEMIGDSTAVSLDVQVVKLGWWLKGGCGCSGDADCLKIVAPAGGGDGYRCKCKDGFDGDGYVAGSGCRRRKESSGCNPSKYLSGHCGGTSRVGLLVGATVAGASLIICIGLIFCFIRRRAISTSQIRKYRRFCETKGITIPVYPYKDIAKATNNFSEKQRLGTGAYGTVYSGRLDDKEWVAIKRIRHRSDDTDSLDQVMNEIKLLSSVSHRNLVRLLGCSVDKDEQTLVYEFMPNGTLSQHLQRERGDGLPWPVRLAVAAETARAIAFLHSVMNPPIYHRDVKSSNILLDHNYNAKVADFGLSRLGITESSHVSTAPQGTPGYLDPEYHQNFHLSDKSDVYSFGVVLVEIVTGLKALDFSRRHNEVNLASLAIDRIKNGRLGEIIDPSLELDRDPWTLSSIHNVAEVAFRCLAFHSDMRPSMTEVAAQLEEIRVSRGATAPEETAVSSPLSIVNEKSTADGEVKKSEFGRSSASISSVSREDGKKFSPESVQDSWPSDSSSDSPNSLLG